MIHLLAQAATDVPSVDALANLSKPALLAVGITTLMTGVKRIPQIPDEVIPLSSMIIGGIAYPLLSGWDVANVIMGLVVGAAATGINQAWRQTSQLGQSDAPVDPAKPPTA